MTKVKIATFNVNSINARLPRVLEWLKNSNPDIVCLQELKCVEENFPFDALLELGYNAAVKGQKTYNGVAILSKFPIEDVVKELPLLDDKPDEQARYIEAVVCVNNKAIRVASIYVPNGGGEILPGQQLEETQKFTYKLDFFDRLNKHCQTLLDYDEILVLGGDYNVGAEEIDVYNPKALAQTVCFHDLERQKFRHLLHRGLTDSYRAQHPQKQEFSWWDYRGGAWQHNKGLRIDYLLTSPLASDHIAAAYIEDKGVRDQEKASDHCPVIVELAL